MINTCNKPTKQSITETQREIENLLRKNNVTLHKIKYGIKKIENELNNSYESTTQVTDQYKPKSRHKNDEYAKYLSPELFDNEYVQLPTNNATQLSQISYNHKQGITPLYEIIDVPRDFDNQRMREARRLIALLQLKKVRAKETISPLQSNSPLHYVRGRNAERRERSRTILSNHSVPISNKRERNLGILSALKKSMCVKLTEKITRISFPIFKSRENSTPIKTKAVLRIPPTKKLEPLKLSCVDIRPTISKTLRVVDQYKSLKASLLNIGTAHTDIVLV